MKSRIIALLIAGVCSTLPVQAQTTAYPFVGRWDCEVSEFTFTNSAYNNGSETLRIQRVTVERNGGYRLDFAKGYRITLSNVKTSTMSWYSHASGDSFTCKKLK